MRIVVTGGSGKLGLETIRQLIAAGHEVYNVDRVLPRENLCKTMRMDFMDYGQCLEAFTHIEGGWDKPDCVVHLAAIPGPSHAANAALFHNNVIATFNVFWAAKAAGIKNVVWASSETLTGVPFTTPPPYLPIDEEVPRRPNFAYSLAKLIDEVMAEEFCRWDPELKMIGLRISYVKNLEDYKEFPSLQDDARKQSWNFWSYIDMRDAAQALVLAVARKTKGFETFNIFAPDTVMERPTEELLAELYPTVTRRRVFKGNESVFSIEKARKVLGWNPRHSWRTER
ncbi:MAG: NAD(P)-dependent oxidoreductase [Hyphomicrobiales bacterium]